MTGYLAQQGFKGAANLNTTQLEIAYIRLDGPQTDEKIQSDLTYLRSNNDPKEQRPIRVINQFLTIENQRDPISGKIPTDRLKSLLYFACAAGIKTFEQLSDVITTDVKMKDAEVRNRATAEYLQEICRPAIQFSPQQSQGQGLREIKRTIRL